MDMCVGWGKTHSYRILAWRPLEAGPFGDIRDRKINKDGYQGDGF